MKRDLENLRNNNAQELKRLSDSVTSINTQLNGCRTDN